MEALAPERRADVAPAPRCNVVELRQYTMRPGGRDTLIELFERAFLDPLESAGMTVLGQYHDLDRPDRFVWMRGFPDMVQRARSLAAFYGGPVWQAHRDAANATMIDSDNVLLLRPAHERAGLALDGRTRAAAGTGLCAERIVMTVHPLRRRADAACIAVFDDRIAPALAAAGARVLGHYVTETHANTYPRLPVREGEHVSVWITAFADDDAHARAEARLFASAALQDAMAHWGDLVAGTPEVLRLAPTLRSLVRG
jgi:hypothetical protein